MARPPTKRFRGMPAFNGGRRTDRLDQVDEIIREHDYGYFARSAALVDEILMDDRIAGVNDQRNAGLRACDLQFDASGEGAEFERAVELLSGDENQPGLWREMLAPEVQGELMTWGRFLGIGLAEICWRREAKSWTPWLRVWHPQFVYWDWSTGRFFVQTLDGIVPLPRPDEEPNGDGKWFLYCPFGVEYGWKRGIIRSIADKAISRQWCQRDWDRSNEKFGKGIVVAKTPPKANEEQASKFWSQLSSLNSESTVECPQGGKGPGGEEMPGYGIELVESKARNFESFQLRKEAIDVDIAIRIVGQNLTTEVQGGSLAAAGEHSLVREDIVRQDAEIAPALGRQVLTWWADANLGDAAYAPRPRYEVDPPDDELTEAKTDLTEGQALQAKAAALQTLKAIEPRVDVAAVLEEEEIPLLSEAEGAKIAEEQARRQADALIRAAAAAGGGDPDGGGGGDGSGGGSGGGGSGGDGGAGPSDESAAPKDKAALAALSEIAVNGSFEDAKLRMLEQIFGADTMERAVQRHQERKAAAAAEAARAAKNPASGVVRRYQFAGLPIAVENPAGSIRQWTDANGTKGATRMRCDYGFIEGHLGGDGEELDCYVGPNEQAANVYVIHQLLAPEYKKWDEDKLMLGLDSETEARALYAAHRTDAERAIGSVSVLPLGRFKAKLKTRSPESTAKIRASQDLDAAHRALVALEQNIAGRGKPSKYQEELLARASKLGVSAMAPVVAALKREIAACSSPEDLQKRILRLARGLPQPADLQDVIYRMSVMSNLHGRDAIMRGA